VVRQPLLVLIRRWCGPAHGISQASSRREPRLPIRASRVAYGYFFYPLYSASVDTHLKIGRVGSMGGLDLFRIGLSDSHGSTKSGSVTIW
jgi:hypothetical protein